MAGGRPVKWDDPEKMQQAIDAYFAECEVTGQPYLVTGLAYALGMTREGLSDYAQKPEFADTVKMARLRVEMYNECRLHLADKPTGAIFVLKNMGWRDVVEQTGDAKTSLVVNVDAGALRDEAERIRKQYLESD